MGSRAAKPAYELQPRDVSLLRGLFESRVMTLAQAAALYFGGSGEAAKKRLQKLKAGGLVRDRPRRPYEPSVLFLAAEGFRLLSRTGNLADYPRIGVASFEKRARVSELTLRHELAVMDVKAAMVAAISARKELSVTEFSTWPLLYQFRASRPIDRAGGYRVETTVKPDGFIRVREEAADGTYEHTFFLEVDRSTESQEVLAAKVLCYRDFYVRGGLAERYGLPASDYRKAPFLVLMVFRTAERRDNAAARLLRCDPPILTQAWLTTFAQITADPLGQVWIRPIDHQSLVVNTLAAISPISRHYSHAILSAKLSSGAQ
jgi:hypothetical protein